MRNSKRGYRVSSGEQRILHLGDQSQCTLATQQQCRSDKDAFCKGGPVQETGLQSSCLCPDYLVVSFSDTTAVVSELSTQYSLQHSRANHVTMMLTEGKPRITFPSEAEGLPRGAGPRQDTLSISAKRKFSQLRD